MFPIYQHTGDEDHNFESFKERMIQICNDHRQSGKALAFAFILYDFENPHLSKILKDSEYWLALNQISGEYLTVFSINCPPIKENNTMQFRNHITTHYNPRIATNTVIQKYFKGAKINYPAILFFQVNNDSVIDSLCIDLEEQETEKGFLELKDFLNRAVLSLKRITPENKQNIREIFNCLESEVKSLKSVKKIVRTAKNVGSLTGLLSSVKGILPQ